MPKSKRARRVALTNVRSKGRDLKTELVGKLRDAVSEYQHVFVFGFDQMRSNLFKQLRAELQTSRIFLGKNKVMALALGRNERDEFMTDLCKVGAQLHGQRGLLFTDAAPAEVQALFAKYEIADYARGGHVPDRTVTLSAGPLPSMPPNMADPLRKLGLRIKLNKGVVTLEDDTDLAVQGQEMTPESARLCKLFEEKLSVFRVQLIAHWSEGTFTQLIDDQGGEEDA